MDDPNQDEDTVDPDERRPMRLLDSMVQPEGELSDSEDEGEGGRRNHARRRDPDSVSNGVGRRFGVGVGIMGAATPAGGTASGSGGPSAHTSIPRLMADSSTAGAETETGSDSMDVDNGALPGVGGETTVVNGTGNAQDTAPADS